MKKALAICIALTVMLSCKKDDNSESLSVQNYFPLEIGNYWTFELAGKDSITSKTKINCMEYFKFVNDHGTVSYFRKQDDKVYYMLTNLNSEEVMFDLGAKVNETWDYGPGYVKMKSRNASITIGNINIDNCLQFDFYNNNLIDYSYTIWLAPGIGFIQKMCQECFGSGLVTDKLKQALIESKSVRFD